jgi:hypothetical protein
MAINILETQQNIAAIQQIFYLISLSVFSDTYLVIRLEATTILQN